MVSTPRPQFIESVDGGVDFEGPTGEGLIGEQWERIGNETLIIGDKT